MLTVEYTLLHHKVVFIIKNVDGVGKIPLAFKGT